MKSPTSSILHSIQALKSKLRNDHFELQGIRRDFAMGPTRPIIQTEQRQQSPALVRLKPNASLEKNARAKLLQVRRAHQQEIKGLQQKHQAEKETLIREYEAKMEQITTMFQQKLNEQVSYIALLEEQAQDQINEELIGADRPTCHDQQIFPMKIHRQFTYCPKVCQVTLNFTHMTFDQNMDLRIFAHAETSMNGKRSGMQKTQEEATVRYDNIVNKLLEENAMLLENVETLKMQNRKLKNDQNSKPPNSDQAYQHNTAKFQQQKSMKQSRSSQYLSLMPVSLQQNYQQSYRSTNPHHPNHNKDRLKFSKGHDRAKTQSNRSYSSISNNQNIDLSNIQYEQADKNYLQQYQHHREHRQSIVEEDQESILGEEMKLKTIKHFMKATSHRSMDMNEENAQYHIQPLVVPDVQIKKGTGLRNALRRISIL